MRLQLLWAAGVALLSPAIASADAVDLFKNARTILPADANAGYTDDFGRQFQQVYSALTAARFHVGSRPSTAPGGLSRLPHPRLVERHGVQYWEVTGELSGIGFAWEINYVYGPFDAFGVDQSANCPSPSGPGSPRCGLRGIVFRLDVPLKWKGDLIVYRSGGLGGFNNGSELYTHVTDEVALIDRGYAFFTTRGAFDSPPDTNPEGSDGLFWRLPEPGTYFPPAVRYALADPGCAVTPVASSCREDLFTGAVCANPMDSSCTAFADFAGSLETSVPTDPNNCCGDIEQDVPTFRDHVHFARNLLSLLTGQKTRSTGFIPYSHSGDIALSMALGRQQHIVPMLLGGLPPKTGGDFETPDDPASGRVIDYFVAMSPAHGVYDSFGGVFEPIADPTYPIAAPLVIISGESDIRFLQAGPYRIANAIAAVLPGSVLADQDLNHWYRAYTGIGGLTHVTREQYFAGPFNGGGTFYEYGDPASPSSGFNREGRGLEVPAWVDLFRANNPDSVNRSLMGEGDQFYSANEPRLTALFLTVIEQTRRWAMGGARPPISHVDGRLVDHISPSTVSPPFPLYAQCEGNTTFDTHDAIHCVAGLEADSASQIASGSAPLDDEELATLQQFVAGALRYTTTPVQPPDDAVPLGLKLYGDTGNVTRLFSDAELRNGYFGSDGRLYAGYGSHEGYVLRWRAAAEALGDQGLYDPDIAARELLQVRQSPVLR